MRIALLGDIGLFGMFSVSNRAEIFEYFEDIANYLSDFDHVIGNLETPLCEGIEQIGQKSAYINASPRDSRLLPYLNVSVVNLANNHMFDYGREGVEQTTAILQDSDIQFFGVDGREVELADPSAKIVLHGYCSYNTNPLGASRKPGVDLNILDLESLELKMREHACNGSLNIVSIHSGQEHVNYPSRDDIDMARYLAGVCDYVYYGHHPHVMQGYEAINGSLLAYSLGNFCFDDVYTDKSSEPLVKQTDNNKAGLIVEIEIQENNIKNYVVRTIKAGEKAMEMGSPDLDQKLADYCDALNQDPEAYDNHRASLISEFMSKRKEARDLDWYLKRLNFNSVGVILRAQSNRYLYKKSVLEYLRSRTVGH